MCIRVPAHSPSPAHTCLAESSESNHLPSQPSEKIIISNSLWYAWVWKQDKILQPSLNRTNRLPHNTILFYDSHFKREFRSGDRYDSFQMAHQNVLDKNKLFYNEETQWSIKLQTSLNNIHLHLLSFEVH